MRKVVIFMFLEWLFVSEILAAPDIKPDTTVSGMHKNAIFGNLGSGGQYFFIGTAYYERLFFKNAQKSPVKPFLRAGFGRLSLRAGANSIFLGQFGLLTGLYKHHLEASAGILTLLGQGFYFSPSASMGYRKQKPDGRFMFRAGMGWPEALYLGLGFSF